MDILQWVDDLHSVLWQVGAIVILAAMLQTVAYLFTNQITLRIFLLAGNGFYLLYYFVAADDPLWSAILGTSAIGVASIYGLLRALAHRSVRMIRADHLPIFKQIGDIEPGAFRKLMKSAQIITFDQPTLMTEIGQMPASVFFTLDGDVDVTKNCRRFSSPPFSWIGEISIIGGFAASATVHSKAGTTAVVWDRKRLMNKMQREEKFRIAVEALFSKDMAQKLAQAAKVDGVEHAY